MAPNNGGDEDDDLDERLRRIEDALTNMITAMNLLQHLLGQAAGIEERETTMLQTLRDAYAGLSPAGRTIVLAVLIFAVAGGVGLAMWLGLNPMLFFYWVGGMLGR